MCDDRKSMKVKFQRSCGLAAWALTLLGSQTACVSTPSPLAPSGADAKRSSRALGRVTLVRTPNQERVSVQQAAEVLANADVVFLGELHDSAAGHEMQLALTKALADERGDIILSFEMFERDAQPELNLYLQGSIDEEQFLGVARPWPHYAEHYRPAVEFAKARRFPVVAANVYRPIAARVARRGVLAGAGDPWAADHVDTSKGEYRRRFNEVMDGGHKVSQKTLDNVYAAQCIKDDTMAESIAEALDRAAVARAASSRWTSPAQARPPLVVHWNGRFHSDFGLGTVERLKSRRPDLNIAVVSMIETGNRGKRLVGDDINRGHFVALVPPTE